jgi:plasmid stability protein
MASITLRNIPERLMNRLRERASLEQRSPDQQAIVLLEKALAEGRSPFSELYGAFSQAHGPSPLERDELDDLCSPETGRGIEL